VLELIRWTLDQMPDQAEAAAQYRNINRLVQANLGTGQVNLEIETLNGIRYCVQKSYDSNAIVLNDHNDPVEIDIGRGNIFSVEIYSQNQIEEIADDPLFQLKLIDKFVSEKVKDLNTKILASIRELETNSVEILKLRKDITELKEQITELPEVTEKLKAFKIEESGEEAKILKKEGIFKAVREQERRCLEMLAEVCSTTAENLENIITNFPEQIAECYREEILEGPNAKIFKK